MTRTTWTSFLSGIVLAGGIAITGTAVGGDGCGVGGSCSTEPMGCQQCDEVFATAGQSLTDQLAAMSCCDGSSCCAPTSCCDAIEGCSAAEDEGCGITFGGWVQMGFHDNNTPNGANGVGSFNSHPDRFNLHQGWLYAEKVADGSDGLDWGFRADVMYGVDGADTQSFGNTPGRWDFQNGFDHGQYAWALPQLYAEVASGDWSLKLGHFYTLVGYEVVTAPDNFFYSHALTMFNSEPFTHTGALVTYSATDDTSIYGGWTAGWDTGFDQFQGGSSFLGGFGTALADDITFTYIATAGEFGWRGNGYSHSLVFDFTLTDKLNYILQSDLVRTNDADANPATVDADDDVGINQYLIYQVDEMIGVGTRVEWWKNEGASQYAATWGVNVKPMDNFIIRPEVRHDWRVAGQNDTETTFGVDAILTF